MHKYILFICLFFYTTNNCSTKPLNLLHLSFHRGCINEINFIAQQLGFTVTSMFIPDLAPQELDGQSSGNTLYNIGHERALNIWNKHKNYFNQFDGVITSDTAPLARIFLQNNYAKPLIIWICNRFDYSDTASLDGNFPDEEYYQLLRDAYNKKNIYTIPYTQFESLYAATKNVFFNHEVIQPIGLAYSSHTNSSIPASIDKQNSFFIPPYLNDASMNLTQECHKLNLKTFNGRYNGPSDLQGFKGIIHIPYAWSNFAFFENMHNDLPYFIPSPTFMLSLLNKGNIWWPNNNFFKDHYHYSEWYSKEHSTIITYFDSWQDLKQKIGSTDLVSLHTTIKEYAEMHFHSSIKKWKTIFDQLYQQKLNHEEIL